MEWKLDTFTSSHQRRWVTREYQTKQAEAKTAGAAAHAAKGAFVNGKRAGFVPAELRPLKTKVTAAAKTAKQLHDALGDGVYVVQIGPKFHVRRFKKPTRAVSMHDTLEAAQAAAEAL